MLRRSQWQALRELAKTHGCTPGDIVGALIELPASYSPHVHCAWTYNAVKSFIRCRTLAITRLALPS